MAVPGCHPVSALFSECFHERLAAPHSLLKDKWTGSQRYPRGCQEHRSGCCLLLPCPTRVLGGNPLISGTPGTMPITLPPTDHQSQEILGASCWGQLHYVSLARSLAMPVCQKSYLRTLLWTAILLSPPHSDFTKTPGFPCFSYCGEP